ncbi:hypothetical protein HBI56_062020 [Parastagonospora nodorum]|uniref:Uncharacterized protein n=1 Tax=Phaeosphaeria nodorum (strain SN15 / ATCC MYA-4574 / FGSC 10173) TaxID=321614 RepID=A0A7U2F306_PHANO|nr:hypothetical protein HBH56_156530 [Parastagonospora nodorum]QRC97536.1 hypothetical protein JI435_410710 [Parastagonospora nodorum SN15]KAH3922868.1 hypothetical protein HBH54_218190 [Parastagonospora nodorum]KAH3947084.1 hypothetical protein HBH53_125340 [Parastagonospora nodorum]KAH3969769.1 hypothetical protein HBH52_173340 [Parastagonospora nodorum]
MLDSMLAPHEPARRALTFTPTTPRLVESLLKGSLCHLSAVSTLSRTPAPTLQPVVVHKPHLVTTLGATNHQRPSSTRDAVHSNRRLAPRQQLAAMGCLVAYAVRVRDTFYCGSPSVC